MLLIFRLAGETFALPVHAVFEILDTIHRTQVPGAPAFVRELINVRGNIVPLLDLRHRLQMQRKSGGTDRIIVLELPVEGQPTRLAILADAVDEVIELPPDGLEPIPELGARWPQRFIRGVFSCHGSLMVLLEPDTVFSPDPVGAAP